MRESALDTLHASFQRLICGGSDEKVQVIGHDHEGMQVIAVLVAVVEEEFAQQAGGALRLQKPFSIGGDNGDEVSLQKWPHAR